MRYAIEDSELPVRSKSHRSETTSSKIFNNIMPENWVVRGLSERDYGIDYYIEFSNSNDQLTGDLVSVQLKGKQSVPWTMSDTFAMSDVSKSTTNYWMNFAVPVFITLVDIDRKELFYLPVKDYLRKNWNGFLTDKFTYHFDRRLKLDTGHGFSSFVKFYNQEIERERFENTLITMVSSFQSYTDFIMLHSNLDFHMSLEDEDIIQIDAILTNYKFLTKYLDLRTDLPSFKELKTTSINYYNDGYIELYEGDLNRIHKPLVETTTALIMEFLRITESEEDYWLHANKTLYKYLHELDVKNLFGRY